MIRLVSDLNRSRSVLRQLSSIRPDAGVHRTDFNSASSTMILVGRRMQNVR